MPFTNDTLGIARIVKAGPDGIGEVHVGMAFIADARHVVTCCHVLNDALNRTVRLDPEWPPTESRFSIRFPFASNRAGTGLVVQWGFALPQARDVAVLRLENDAPADAGLAAFSNADVRGEKWFCIGWDAKAVDRGVQGEVGPTLATGRCQLNGISGRAPLITRGYSGAGVWSDITNAFVGMVETIDIDQAENGVAWAIPTSVLLEVWPRLKHGQDSATDDTRQSGTGYSESDVPKSLHIPPIPEIDEDAVSGDRFFGREGMLHDFDVDLRSVIAPAGLGSNGRPIRLVWYHGFGGLGKSSLIHRACVDAKTRSPNVKIGLVAWDVPRLCYPVQERVLGPADLFAAVAVRLHQLYGAQPLAKFWRIYDQANAVETLTRRSNVEARFASAMRAVELRQASQGDASTAESTHSLSLSTRFEHDIEAMIGVLNEAEIKPTKSNFKRRLQEIKTRVTLHERILQRWAQRCLSVNEADDLVLRPYHLLAETLQACVRSVVELAPLLLIFDTYERLEDSHDEWIRLFVTPLLRESSPLLVVVAGRSPPDANWLNDVPEFRRRIIDFGDNVHFTPQEIAGALARIHHGGEASSEFAKAIHRATRGMPLAVGMLLDQYRGDSTTFADWEIEEIEEYQAPEESLETIVAVVTRRILLHLDWDDTSANGDLFSIAAMAILTSRHRAFLERLWADVGYATQLERLRRVHSFIVGNDLHVTVRRYLRRHFRLQSPPCLTLVLDRLREIHRHLPSEFETGADGLDFLQTFEELNLKSWSADHNLLSAFSSTLVVFLAYQKSLDQVIALGDELPDHSSDGKRIKRILFQWRDFPNWADPWDNSHFRNLTKSDTTQWTSPEIASFKLLLGLAAVDRGSFDEGLKQLDTALAVLRHEAPRRDQISAAYVKLACTLADSKAVESALKAATLLKVSQISDWTVGLFRWHDQIVSNKRSDIDVLVGFTEKVLRGAEILYCEVSASSDELDSSEFDPTPLTLFLAHMLSRHGGHHERALECYNKVRSESVKDVRDALAQEYAEFLAGQGRFLELSSLLAGRDVELPILARIVACIPSDSKGDPIVKSIIAQLLELRSDFKRINDPKTLADMALALAEISAPDANELALRAIPLAKAKDVNNMNNVAWRLYKGELVLDEAADLARLANRTNPEDDYALQTFLALLVRTQQWAEALPLLSTWAARIGKDHLEAGWNDFLYMFKDIVKNGYADEVAGILKDLDRPEVWSERAAALLMISGKGVDIPNISSQCRKYASEFAT